jgi:hypothetical protein
MLARLTKAGTAILVVSLGLITAPTASAATTAEGTPTDYAMSALSYATQVDGGDLPLGVGKLGIASLSCTNLAGLSKTTREASIPLQGLATVSGAQSHVFTYQVGDKVSSWGTHKIAKVTLIDVGGIGTLSLSAIKSNAHAYHDATGYHAETHTSLGKITLTLLGIPVDFPVPPVGQSITIPGLAEISVGAGTTTVTENGASASASAVTIKFFPTDSTIVLASTHASISGHVRSALFEGSSTGVTANVLDGTIKVGKTPYLAMPCRGTGGHVRSRDVASVDLGTLGSVGALSTSEYAKKTANHANSWQEADVAGVSLLNDTLVVTGVVGRVSASYTKGGDVVTSNEGTEVASVTFNGTVIELPAHGSIDIPGVATLSTDVEHQYANGLKLTALQITLLGGTGGVINLATVRTVIKPSGL